MKVGFTPVFIKLKAILQTNQGGLSIVTDEEKSYYLDTLHVMENKKPLFFGSVRIAKNYVSFHLMPVYTNPQLLEDISPQLKKRMQGKSCFNFKSIDEAILEELASLVQRCKQHYIDKGYV